MDICWNCLTFSRWQCKGERMQLFSEVVTRGIGATSLALRNTSPTIFFVGGVAGVVASTVLACKATLKLEETLDECRKDREVIHHDEQTIIESEVEGSVHYFRAVVSIGRLYGPAIVIGGASIAMLTQSHNILIKRNAALTAAYTALDKGFRDYRARVIEKYGKDEDDHFRYGSEVDVIPVKEGKNLKIPQGKVGPDGASIYAVWYDQFNHNWSKDPEINKLFLRTQQNFLNDLLNVRGHLFLNEAYEALGFDHTQAGSVVGWILRPDNDNFIDLGVFNSAANASIRDFVNGREGSVLLDFNVDGVIFDKIDRNKERIKWQRN
jgi:Family of unknown function (DUF6353)